VITVYLWRSNVFPFRTRDTQEITRRRGLKKQDVGGENLPDWGLARTDVARPDSAHFDRPDDAAVIQESDREIVRKRWTQLVHEDREEENHRGGASDGPGWRNG